MFPLLPPLDLQAASCRSRSEIRVFLELISSMYLASKHLLSSFSNSTILFLSRVNSLL
ncbi:TAZ8R-like protein [synthetic Vaccinia virus]|nr:TAZ8R-like protein [synthetic Vaccinia virus]